MVDSTHYNNVFFFFFCLHFPSKVQIPLCLWWYCKKSRQRPSQLVFFTMPSSKSVLWSVFPSGLPNVETLASNSSSLLSIEIPTAWSKFILAGMTSDRDAFCCFCERQVNLKIPNSLPYDNPMAFSHGKLWEKEKKNNLFVHICFYLSL